MVINKPVDEPDQAVLGRACPRLRPLGHRDPTGHGTPSAWSACTGQRIVFEIGQRVPQQRRHRALRSGDCNQPPAIGGS